MDILNINKLKETIFEYVKIKSELLKLDITAYLSKILAKIIAYIIIIFITLLVFVYASIALANYLNGVWENNFGGYLVISGFFSILLFIVLYFLKSGKLKAFLESKIIENNNKDITRSKNI